MSVLGARIARSVQDLANLDVLIVGSGNNEQALVDLQPGSLHTSRCHKLM